MNTKSKVIDLMQEHFSWLNDDEDSKDGISNRISSQCNTLDELAIGHNELMDFTEVLIAEFDLEDIEFAEIMEWRTVKDIVKYIRDKEKI